MLPVLVFLSAMPARADLSLVGGHYLFGHFEKALQLLEEMEAADPATAASSLEHQVWLARCSVQVGEDKRALAAFCRVRELDPGWQPDPELIPDKEHEVFDRVLKDCACGPALLTILSEPQGAEAWLDNEELPGRTPVLDLVRDCGSFELVLRLDGYKEDWLTIEVRSPTTEVRRTLVSLPPTPSRLAEKTRGRAVTRSLIPGLGQFYKEQPAKGKILLGAATVAAGVSLWGYLQRRDRLVSANEAWDDYMAQVAPAAMDRTYATYMDRVDAVRRSENLRDIGLYAFVGVYVFNLVDAALGFPLGEKNVSVSAAAAHPGEARLAVSIAGR